MSDCDEARSDVGAGDRGIGGIVEENDRGNKGGDGCEVCPRRGKKNLVLIPFRKFKRQFHWNKRNGPSSSAAAGCLPKRVSVGDGVVGGCYFCLKPPRSLDALGESRTSDPNSCEFSYDMLRSFVEKNDFYSIECNTHLG